MKCPFCGEDDSKVIDSRPADDGASIRRRRSCISCNRRFTTYERVEAIPIFVIKKDNSRQLYDRSKVESGIFRSINKRPVSVEQVETMIDEIESIIFSSVSKEVKSSYIGELVLEKLKKVDAVAYVRFASIYMEFNDVDTFMDVIKELKN
ncbi:MAG: transcriptional regulator NrdR [Lachnospiraceae bacterium]|nr:transcriptional regulator NrdR [Lachnospiraceae bacterium]